MTRIGTSKEAAWFPGSPVYDGLHRCYGSIVEVKVPPGSQKADSVKLTGHGLTWWTNARDVVTLEGERPSPERGVVAERLLRQLIDNVAQFHATSRDPKTSRLQQAAQRAFTELSAEVRANPNALNSGAVSESDAWADVARIARRLPEGRERRDLLLLAIQMQEQVGRGIHTNPTSLVTHLALGNPGTSEVGEVLWIIYRHREDRSYRGHAFNSADFDIKSMPNGRIVLTGTATRSSVIAVAMPDGSCRLHHRDGKPVLEDF